MKLFHPLKCTKMTNSAPKVNDKIERQSSPNLGSSKQRTYPRKSYCFKTLTTSPIRVDLSPRGSPTSFYAGAKFSEPPSPASLPKPPSHWTARLLNSCQQSNKNYEISNHLKMILNVQAWYPKMHTNRFDYRVNL